MKSIFPNSDMMTPSPRIALARWRVQVLRAQWLVHRSLSMPANFHWDAKEAEYRKQLREAEADLEHLETAAQ